MLQGHEKSIFDSRVGTRQVEGNLDQPVIKMPLLFQHVFLTIIFATCISPEPDYFDQYDIDEAEINEPVVIRQPLLPYKPPVAFKDYVVYERKRFGNIQIHCHQNHSYDIPRFNISTFKPSGLLMWFTDEPGIESVELHLNVNEVFRGAEKGQINTKIIEPDRGKWSFYYRNLKLRFGDRLYWWVKVINNGQVFKRFNHELYIRWAGLPPNSYTVEKDVYPNYYESDEFTHFTTKAKRASFQIKSPDLFNKNNGTEMLLESPGQCTHYNGFINDTQKRIKSSDTPEAVIDHETLRGVNVWLPDQDGIESFEVQLSIGQPIDGFEQGEFSAKIIEPDVSYWKAMFVPLQFTCGDYLYGWTKVMKNGKIHRRKYTKRIMS